MKRETDAFTVEDSPRGIRITTKERGAVPRSRVVPKREWGYLSGLSDASFNGACCLDFGVGVFRR